MALVVDIKRPICEHKPPGKQYKCLEYATYSLISKNEGYGVYCNTHINENYQQLQQEESEDNERSKE